MFFGKYNVLVLAKVSITSTKSALYVEKVSINICVVGGHREGSMSLFPFGVEVTDGTVDT
jgi:hypothetical protein